MRILVIDDEDDIRRVIRLSLVSLGGLEVVEASNGPDGVREAEHTRPDAIVLDVMMPSMDGPETLAVLRANPATAAIPVVFLTAKVLASEVERLEALGAVGVLTKPFDPVTLPGQLRDILGRAEGHRHGLPRDTGPRFGDRRRRRAARRDGAPRVGGAGPRAPRGRARPQPGRRRGGDGERPAAGGAGRRGGRAPRRAVRRRSVGHGRAAGSAQGPLGAEIGRVPSRGPVDAPGAGCGAAAPGRPRGGRGARAHRGDGRGDGRRLSPGGRAGAGRNGCRLPRAAGGTR